MPYCDIRGQDINSRDLSPAKHVTALSVSPTSFPRYRQGRMCIVLHCACVHLCWMLELSVVAVYYLHTSQCSSPLHSTVLMLADVDSDECWCRLTCVRACLGNPPACLPYHLPTASSQLGLQHCLDPARYCLIWDCHLHEHLHLS